MTIATAPAGIGKSLRFELLRLLRGLLIIGAGLLAFVLVLRFIPYSEILAEVAAIIVIAGALAAGLTISLRWNRPLFAWLLSWTVVPGYLFLVDLIVPRSPHALDALAYVFGTFSGAIAGGIGAVCGYAIARARRNDT